jgi:uncharacterized protein involved in exopolysaccharide biosynthesis
LLAAASAIFLNSERVLPMGMFEKEDQTLFKPAPTRGPTSDAPPAQAYRQQEAADDEEERASLGETVLFAFNSARRRKLLSIGIVLLGAGLTFAAVKLAPRTYVSAGEVLISKPRDDGAGWNPDRDKREQAEWGKQIKQRSTIENVIKDAKLVDRWDDMRQPYRRLLDSFGKYTGEKAVSSEQRFGSLVGMLDGKLQLNIDQTTVTILVEWPEPEASRDIVDAAMKRFIDKRYETEVSRTLNAIKPLEEQLEAARSELEKMSPSLAPPREKPTQSTLPSQAVDTKVVDPEVLRRLGVAKERQQQAAGKLQEQENQKNQRIAGVQNQLTERSSVLGPAHPEIVALKAQLEQAQRDTPELSAARASKGAIDEEVSSLAAQAGVIISRTVYRAGSIPIPQDRKLDEQTLARIASARARYDQTLTELDKERRNLKTAEEDFKIKYQVSHPPDVPYAPKKPVGLMVTLGGIILTLVLVLLLASLRDRASGVLFEAKHIRDKLRMPVLGDLHEKDIS